MDKETLASFEKVRNAIKGIQEATMELKETNMKIVENLHSLSGNMYEMEKELIALKAAEAKEGNFKN